MVACGADVRRYLISIGIAWLAGPPRETTPSREDLPAIRLVFAASRHRPRSQG